MASARSEMAVQSTLILMGVFTIVPELALFDPSKLESYGVTNPDTIALTLSQHRGLPQFALGASLVYAAFKPDIRLAVGLAALFTTDGSLLLTAFRPEVLANASGVALVFDPLCIVLLAACLVGSGQKRRRPESAVSSGA